MTTSSPLDTRSSSSQKWVFASNALTLDVRTPPINRPVVGQFIMQPGNERDDGWLW